MTEFTTLLQQGNAWFFIPSAILLGALHGLEPGHSKTMMAAFIIAIKGTIKQAVMLGLAFASLLTWTIWLAKAIELLMARRRLEAGLSARPRPVLRRAAGCAARQGRLVGVS